MSNKNDFSTTFLKVGMKYKNAEKIVNYLIDKNITLSGTVLLTMIGSKQMYEILIKKCLLNAKIIIADSKLVTYYFNNKKNITCVTVKENDADDFYNKLKNMPKFDFIVQNPPYSGSLHLDFLKKGYEMLSDKGQMIIIEPATWLIDVRKHGKKYEEMRVQSSEIKKYDELKNLLNKNVKTVIIDNFNKEFNTVLQIPFSIIYVDKLYNSDEIDCKVCGYKKCVNTLYDCNLVGDYDIIWSIFNKISKCEKIKRHIYDGKQLNENNFYIPYMTLCPTILSINAIRPNSANTSTWFFNSKNGDYFKSIFGFIYHPASEYKISNIIPKSFAQGGSTAKQKKFSNKDAACITASKKELENWKHFVFNNSLPLFISLTISIDQNNRLLNFIPWLVDKKYTDQEIYDMFNFTDAEIKLIETTIKKFERNSPWFKRYMCGPRAVTDEEVQKFIEDLNYVKG